MRGEPPRPTKRNRPQADTGRTKFLFKDFLEEFYLFSSLKFHRFRPPNFRMKNRVNEDLPPIFNTTYFFMQICTDTAKITAEILTLHHS